MYLSSSERIIGDILGRGDQFPIIFGVVAIMFGITRFTERKICCRLRYQKTFSSLHQHLFFSCILLVATLVEGGNPGFWVFYSSVGDRSIDVHVYYAKSELGGTVPYG